MAQLKFIDVKVYRVPLERPVRTSFGEMRDRPAVLVCLTDTDDHWGWGEVFCNWPAAGAEHRARLILEDIAELVFDRNWSSAPELFASLTTSTEIKVIQTAEPGPFAQAISGLDMAMWDLMSRKAGMPLCRALDPHASLAVPVYASGIQIDDASSMIPAARDAGFSAFKVKVGFDSKIDAEKLCALKQSLHATERLMADANQGWGVDEASNFLQGITDIDLTWLEEPIRVDAPKAAWQKLAMNSKTPLAGGENLLGYAAFTGAIDDGHLSVIQPDAAKWGGVTGCFDIGSRVRDAGRLYCPHFLGAGIGLLASGHILAAVGGDGMLEIDANPNPLRSDMCPGWPHVNNGMVSLPDAPGLGIAPTLDNFEQYCVFEGTRRS